LLAFLLSSLGSYFPEWRLAARIRAIPAQKRVFRINACKSLKMIGCDRSASSLSKARAGRQFWWKRPAVRLYPPVVIYFQHLRRLFFPNYFVVLSNAGDEAKQAVSAVKCEGPDSVIRHDCQVSLSNDRLQVRGRSPNQFIPGAWHCERLRRFEYVFGRSDYCRQPIINKCIHSTAPSHLHFPQKARGHYVGHLHITIIGNAEP